MTVKNYVFINKQGEAKKIQRDTEAEIHFIDKGFCKGQMIIKGFVLNVQDVEFNNKQGARDQFVYFSDKDIVSYADEQEKDIINSK